MLNQELPHEHGIISSKVLEQMPSIEQCVEIADTFKQVSDGTRLRIFWLLCHCEECVSNISAIMDMSDPAVSHHLKVLKKSNLIMSKREGKEIYYKVSQTPQAELLHHVCEELFYMNCPKA